MRLNNIARSEEHPPSPPQGGNDRDTRAGKKVFAQTLRGLGWMGAAKIISQSFSWVVTIYVARLLSPNDYGLMGVAGLLIVFFNLFNDLGLGQALVRHDEQSEETLSSAFWFILALGCCFYLLALALAPVVAAFYRNPKLVPIIGVLGVNFIVGGLRSVPANLLVKNMRFDLRARIETIAALASSALTLALAQLGFGVWTLVAASLAQQAVSTLATYCYSPWRPRWHARMREIKPLLEFGGKVSGTFMIGYFFNNADTMIIGRVLGERLTGIYNMAYQLAHLPVQKVNVALNPVFYAALAQLKNEAPHFRRYFFQMTRLTANVAIPVFVFMAANAPLLFELALTEKWAEAVFPFQVLCGVGGLRLATILLPQALNALNQPEKNLRANLLCLALLPLGFYLGATRGLVGVACAWLLLYPWCELYRAAAMARALNCSLLKFLAEFRVQAALLILQATAQLAFVRWMSPHFSSPVLFLAGQAGVATLLFLFVIKRAHPGLLSNPKRYLREAAASL
jgi:O-antigen/teichoic acid export membrane protein